MIDQVEKILLRIKTLREAKNLKYNDMLTEVTVETPGAYAKIEKSKTISLLRLLEISKVLDVDAASWFENLSNDSLVVKDEIEKYGKDELKNTHDIYLLVCELKKEILLLKKEVAEIKTPATIKRKSAKKSN